MMTSNSEQMKALDVEVCEDCTRNIVSESKNESRYKPLLLVGGVILGLAVLFMVSSPSDSFENSHISNTLFGTTVSTREIRIDERRLISKPKLQSVMYCKAGSNSSSKCTTNLKGGDKPREDQGSASTSSNQGSTQTSTASNQNSKSNDSQFRYVNFTGAFNGSLPLFDSSVAEGYNGNEKAFKSDLTNVARYYINDLVRQNTGNNYNPNQYYSSNPVSLAKPMEAVAGSAATTDASKGTAVDSSVSPVGDDVNSFETNNQEEGVNEADVVMSDGTTVYAAYGDYIVIWNAKNGTNLGNVRLPSIKEALNDIDPSASSNASSLDYYWYDSPPSVSALLLYNNRLVVIAQGYGSIYTNILVPNPVLTDYRSTRIYLYDTSNVESTGKLKMIGYNDVNGYYSEARAIGPNIHVVTMSGINYYPYFDNVFQRYQFASNLTDEEYIQKVQQAGKDAVPKFVNELTKELTINGELPDIARMSVMQTEWNSSQANDLVYDGGINNFYVQVSSFDMTAPTLDVTDSGKLDFNSAGAFLPVYGAQVYAAVDTLIIAANGYDYIPNSWAYNQFTYLLAMALDGPTAATKAVGQVPGTLMNNYAMDVVNNVLRIGTTVTRNGWCCGPWIPRPMPVDFTTVKAAPMLASGVATESAAVTTSDIGSTRRKLAANGTLITNTLPPETYTSSPTTNPVATNTLPPGTEESSTTNYITTLSIPNKNGDQVGNMTQLGQLKLGNMDESFTAIRFFDNVAYAVTFLRRDPFYVLDLSDPSNLKVLGELNITGFSDYLHSMNNDNTLLLGIGQETDDSGVVLGLQVTVFDVTNPAAPRVANRYTFEVDKDTYSSSEVAWDFKAIRYDQGSERLILPVDINNYETPSKEFHGFYVFVVNENEITPYCRIAHGQYGRNSGYCYYCAFFPMRSMIFGGDVTTMDGHYVRSTDLNTCSSVWELEIKLSDQSNGCCGWF